MDETGQEEDAEEDSEEGGPYEVKMKPSLQAPSPAKTKRLSIVALSGAVLALLWAVAEWLGADVPAVVVSTATALGMLVSGWIDFKHSDDELYNGVPDGG